MRIFYLDLETSGLDPAKDDILEIAVSEADLSSPFDARPVYHAVLTNARVRHAKEHWDPVVFEMHSKNGLLAECLSPGARGNLREVEREILALVPDVEGWEEKPTLAGNCVGFDHGFLKADAPTLAARFHYRYYDVSSVKLFCRSLGMQQLPKMEAHRAREDVLESIAHARLCAEWLGREFGTVPPDVLRAADAVLGHKFGTRPPGSGSRLPLPDPRRLGRQVVPLRPGEQAPPETAIEAPPAGYRWETWGERRARLKTAPAGA